MPIGPSYTPMPRDDQREAVDKTFQDIVGESKRLKGSVFDTWKDAGIRALEPSTDFAGAFPGAGVAGAVGIVANPASKLFQQLQHRSPKFAGGLQRVPETTEYLSKPIREMRDAWGVTSVLPKPEDRAAGLAGQIEGRRGITKDEIKRLAERGPGASLQSFPAGRVADETLFHEGLHSLYARKFPETQFPSLSPERAQELIVRTMRRMGASDDAVMAVLRQYGKDPSHGLVDVLARYNAHKTGGTGVIR